MMIKDCVVKLSLLNSTRPVLSHTARPASSSIPSLFLLRSLVYRSEEHTSELQSLAYLVCRLLLEKKKLQQLNGLEKLVIIMVANKYAFLQITRRRFLNEWEALKKVISRRNIRRRITIRLTRSNLKLLRRITRTENILHRNFTRRQFAIQHRVASNIGIFFFY